MELTEEEMTKFTAYLNGLFEEVDQQAWERHLEGAEKYGPLKFLGVDTFQEAVEELLDLINYARYTAVKLKMLQRIIAQEAAPMTGETAPQEGFIPTSELFKGH